MEVAAAEVEADSAGVEAVVDTMEVVEEGTMTTVVATRTAIVVATPVVEDTETEVAEEVVDTAEGIVTVVAIHTRIVADVIATSPAGTTHLPHVMVVVGILVVMIVAEIASVAVEITVSPGCMTTREEGHAVRLPPPDTWQEMSSVLLPDEATSHRGGVITPQCGSPAVLITSHPRHLVVDR